MFASSRQRMKNALREVVHNEPESAALAKAKNNWKWENQVFHRLNKYVPPNPKDIATRQDKLRDEAQNTCAKADSLCGHNVRNMKTCVKAKEACFHAKVAAGKVVRASKICVDAQNMCGRKDFKSKGDCLVQKAKCKKFVMATNHSVKLSEKISKKVRDMEILDKEAEKLSIKVDNKRADVEALEAKAKKLEKVALQCKKYKKVEKECMDNADFSAECQSTIREVKKCTPILDAWQADQTKIKDKKRHLSRAKAERDGAEKEARESAFKK